MLFQQRQNDADEQFANKLNFVFWVVFYPCLAVFLYQLVLKPYFMVRFYRKQGAAGKYLPGINFSLARSQDAHEYGDYMHYFKNTMKTNPKTRFFASNLGSQCILYLASPDLIKEFQKAQTTHYVKAGHKTDLVHLFLGDSVLIGEGSRWKTQKKLLLNSFHNEKLRDVTPIISQVAQNMYEKLSKKSPLEDVNIFQENDKIASETFGVFFFGERFLKHKFEGESLGTGLSLLLNLAFSELDGSWSAFIRQFFVQPGFTPRHKHILKRIQAFRQICKTMIADKKKFIEDNQKEETVLQMLVDQQRLSPEHCLTDEEIIDLFLNLFFAGTDHVANLVTMALYYLGKNPEVHKKLSAEIHNVFGESQEIKNQTLQQMDYTLAVLKETLMKTNPDAFSIPRVATSDHKLGNITIKKDTIVIFSPLLQNSLDTNFGPERWQGSKSPLWKEDNSGFNAFSAGAHSCLGQNFALLQAKIMLGLFVRYFKMELPSDLDLKMTYKTTYKPLHPIKMTLDINQL